MLRASRLAQRTATTSFQPMSALAALTTPCARTCSIHPQERELARYRLVLFCCDAWLPADDSDAAM
jgi:hypothetical protein